MLRITAQSEIVAIEDIQHTYRMISETCYVFILNANKWVFMYKHRLIM